MDNSNVTTQSTPPPASSTLIEFPGVNRNRPAWRKELSERFREIQQKRAREADLEAGASARTASDAPAMTPEAARAAAAARAAETASKQLGLVPPPEEPELNPLVAAALRRIERARASEQVARTSAGRGHAATAAARAVEEQRVEAPETASPPPPLVVVQPKPQPPQKPEPLKAEQPQAARPESSVAAAPAVEPKAPADAPRAPEHAAVAQAVESPTVPRREAAAEVQSRSEAAAEAEAEHAARQPRKISGVLDEFWLERQGIELLPKVEERELSYDDRAPRLKRVAGAFVDLLAVALLSAPFAAAIELTIGNWQDQRVWGSMALIAALVMFLYHTCSVALAGRTLGMKLCGLQAVDARKACVPTTGQCARRALVYMLSLATLGLGLLYSLFDAEGRAAHDLLSGTVVVRK